MALDKFGLIGAGFNFTTSLASGIAQNAQTVSYNKALADTYRTQARLSLLNAATENMYANEELGYNIWDIKEQGKMFEGTQMANLAASGFSMSTGDKRLIAETERGTQEMMDSANRQAYLESYERYRKAYLDDIQYKAQAKIADINRKYASGWRGFATSFTNASLSALGGYFQFAQPSGKINNVGYGQNVGFTDNLPSHVGKLDYSGKVNLSGMTRMF